MELYFQPGKRFGTLQLWAKLIFIIAVFLFTGAAAFAQDNILEDVLKTTDKLNQELLNVTSISDKDENKIGKELDKEISKKLIITESKKFDVGLIFKKIKAGVSRKKIDYRFKIVRDTEVNAYSIAGGMVYVNTGLLDFVSNDDELAFVIGHEISHNEKKHCIKKIQYAVLASNINQNLGAIVQTAYSVYDIPFTKYQEYEADELGVKLMTKAGYDKKGALSFFDKLKKLEQKYGEENRDALNDFISSHPTAEDRKEKIEKMQD